MQNKCNCGCEQGFVPVSGNWDFNNGCGCQQGYTRQSGSDRRNRRNTCGECEQTYARPRDNDDCRSGSDCQCERCDDSREVECCEQNTYIREMDEGECRGDADCPCEACAVNRARSRRSRDCDACNRNRSNTCGCKDDDNASTYARSRKNRTVGMINMEMQEIDEIFESESALRAGTLFPELHKPMNGYCPPGSGCPCEGNCGTCQQAAAFAAWEMRLYLNTHPGDKEALALFRKLCKEAGDENYATTFLTDECSANGWNWVKNPWPWEYACNCGRRSGADKE